MSNHFGHTGIAGARIFGTRCIVILSFAIALIAFVLGSSFAQAQTTGGPYYQQQPAAGTGGSVYGRPATTTGQPAATTGQPAYGTGGVTPRPGYSNPQPVQGQSPYQPRTTVPAPNGGVAQPARPAAPQAIRAPFTLSAAQQAQVDQVLTAWCNRSAQIQRFESKFAR